MMSEVKGCFGGSSSSGNLMAALRGALWILPPQRIRPSLSRNSSALVVNDTLNKNSSFLPDQVKAAWKILFSVTLFCWLKPLLLSKSALHSPPNHQALSPSNSRLPYPFPCAFLSPVSRSRYCLPWLSNTPSQLVCASTSYSLEGN